MSSTARAPPSTSHANGDLRTDSIRPRVSHSYRTSDRTETRYRESSPQVSYSSTSHKRTASGNPRPGGGRPAAASAAGVGGGSGVGSGGESSRTTRGGTPISSAEHANERRTERMVITTREVLVSRTRSPERRGSPAATTTSHRSGNGRSREDVRAPREVATTGGGEVAEPAPVWKPEARLVPHTTAPLASRISIPPRASTMPASLQPTPLGSMSLEAQEAAMLEDLLCVFMGCEGQYIRFAKGYDAQEERERLSGPTWRILPGLDASLQDLTVVMLRTATHYAALEAFVDVQSREVFGLVNHALCAAVRRLLQDYLVLIGQLETQFLTDAGFTLHVLNLQMLGTGQMMGQLYVLAQELLRKNGLLDEEEEDSVSSEDGADDYDKIINQLREGGDLVPGHAAAAKICKGAAVLETVTRRLEAMAGDPAARVLLTTLLREASRPYMGMLNEWLHHGGISDPHGEFLVKEQKSIRRELLEVDYTDEYWDRRYTLRERDVPPQLAGVRDKVLLAGKYLNVVRECGGVDTSARVADVPTSFDDARFLDNIHGAYAHANAALMRLLLTAHALPARLRSVKHYFLLDPADYFSYFLELGHNELRKRSLRAVNTGKLQSLLDLVLRQPGSAVALDPFKEDVKVEMNDTTLVQALQRVVNITGIDQGEALVLGSEAPTSTGGSGDADGYASLQLDYAVPFPVSLVIGRKTIWRYQALFRFLLSLHHLESQLATTWQSQMGELAWCHRSSSGAVAAWKRRLWTLRARMMVFVQQLLAFCTAEVIEPNWQAFMARLEGADAVASGSAGSSAPAAAAPAAATTATPSLPGRTVDELMQDHVDFLDTCLKECMLTNSKLIKIHAKLMHTCFSFVNYVSYLTRNMDKVDRDLAGPTRPRDATPAQWTAWQQVQAQRQPEGNTSIGGGNTSTATAAAAAPEEETRLLVERLAKYEHLFGRNLQVLLDALNHYAATETVVLLSLCARLSTANHGSEYAGLRHDEDLL